jgi:predicted DNA-binding transcriptional regulator AlpA
MDGSECGTWSIAESCQRLGIGTSTGYYLIARDEFPVPVHIIGGVRKVLQSDLERFLAGEAMAAYTPPPSR